MLKELRSYYKRFIAAHFSNIVYQILMLNQAHHTIMKNEIRIYLQSCSFFSN